MLHRNAIPKGALACIVICAWLVNYGVPVEMSADESFMHSHANEIKAYRLGSASPLIVFKDSLAPNWSGTKFLPGSLVQGMHMRGEVSHNTALSLTLLQSAEIRPAPSLGKIDRAGIGSGSLFCRQGASGVQTLYATSNDDGSSSIPMALQLRGSLTRFRIDHRSASLNLRFECVRADKDLATANGSWANTLNSIAPLPRSINALKGTEFTSLSFDAKLGALNAIGSWHSLSSGGDVERQTIRLHGSKFKFHLGETRIKRGSAISAPAAAEELAALTSEFDSIGREFSLIGAPMKLAGLQPISNLHEEETLLLWEPSKDAQLRHEALRISIGSSKLFQSTWALNLIGGKLTAMRKVESVDAGLNAQSLKLVGKEAMANLVGQSQTITQVKWKPSNALQLTHTVVKHEALQGASSNVRLKKESSTELSLMPDKHTAASLIFGETEKMLSNGSVSQAKFTQWSFSRHEEFGGHKMSISHFGRRVEPSGSAPFSLMRFALSLAINPKSSTTLNLDIVRTDEHPNAGNDGTHTRIKFQSRLSGNTSLLASWERKPTAKGIFRAGECMFKLSQLELSYRERQEPLSTGIEQKLSQLQLQHPISDNMNIVISMSSAERGDEKVKENSVAVVSEKPGSDETLIKAASIEMQTEDKFEQAQSVMVVQSLSKEMQLGAEITQTSDNQGNEGEQQKIYIAAMPKSDASPQVHIGYMRVRPPLGEATEAPLVRLSMSGNRRTQFAIGYALNQTQQFGQLPMREMVFKMPLGKASFELYRFSNMPQNWAARWAKECWFSRAPFSSFPTLPSGQKLSQLNLIDWAMLSLNMPIANGWTLQLGVHRNRPYANTNATETESMFANFCGKTGRNGNLQLSITHVTERQKTNCVDGLIYTLSFSWRVSNQRYISLSAHYSTDERLKGAGATQGKYSLALSFSSKW